MNPDWNPVVVPFTESAAESLHGGYIREVHWIQFHRWRNAVLRVLRQYGTVGPMGERPIGRGASGRHWQVESSDPDFYVVDDQWSTGQKWIHVETEVDFLARELLSALAATLHVDKEWAVHLLCDEGNLLVFCHTILVDKPLFQACASLEDILAACKQEKKKDK